MKFIEDIHNFSIPPFIAHPRPDGDRDINYPSLVRVVPDSFNELITNRTTDVLLLLLDHSIIYLNYFS